MLTACQWWVQKRRREKLARVPNPGLSDGEFFLIEECKGPEEAEGIAEHYRSIVEKIRAQMDEQ
jgi:hypothetical protein